MSNSKYITINILPQSPFAWAAIALGVAIAFISLSNPDETDVEREKTKRVQMLINAGYTNAVMEEIKGE